MPGDWLTVERSDGVTELNVSSFSRRALACSHGGVSIPGRQRKLQCFIRNRLCTGTLPHLPNFLGQSKGQTEPATVKWWWNYISVYNNLEPTILFTVALKRIKLIDKRSRGSILKNAKHYCEENINVYMDNTSYQILFVLGMQDLFIRYIFNIIHLINKVER